MELCWSLHYRAVREEGGEVGPEGGEDIKEQVTATSHMSPVCLPPVQTPGYVPQTPLLFSPDCYSAGARSNEKTKLHGVETSVSYLMQLFK